MATPLSTRPPPWTVPCLVTTTTFTIGVEGIPGAAASVHALLHEYGLPARWKPVADLAEAPYAFVALGVHVHAAWFRRDRYVALYELTACGRQFHTLREALLPRADAPSTTGPCTECLIVWRARYA
ncbi:hypothetical protein [Haloactinomyces albus]|uniref:Uncharacterized protein n=1 Tax=Haloactinomyces albus TaxID=1352928 RepID=A0AAE3ZGS3_9ACTN|nr:hypothetical protein [Haloactinomyces albus]MDR7303323.1 hypothetical protein [Haloactinomyces albus]